MSYIIILIIIIVIIFFLNRFYVAQTFDVFFTKNQYTSNHYSEILKVLLNLNENSLKELFKLYKETFGQGASYYAKNTYQKWKTGKVQPNRKTVERFLQHLPKVMSYDLKCEILRHLMEEYCSQKDYELTIYTDDWEKTLTPLVREVIDAPYNAELPLEIQRRLTWLAHGEMQIAQEILRQSQVEEGKIAVSMLREEFSNIENLLAEKHLRPKVTHQLKFPYGTITLNIKRRK